MTRPIPILCVLALALGAPASALAEGLAPGMRGGDFSLEAPDGATVTLEGLLAEEAVRAVVVDITSYDCPFSKRADAELVPLTKQLGARGIRFVSIFPNQDETTEGIRAYAEQAGVTHLLLKDPDGAVARRYGAGVTPTFFVFDKTGVLRYRGNLKHLTEALDAVLVGKTVALARSDPVGCTISWPVPEARTLPPEPGTEESPVPELSDGAKQWLERLISSLASEDQLVRRAAQAGIQALGPGALPQLRRAREGAEGTQARALDRAIRLVALQVRFRRPNRMGRGERRSMLDLQRRLLERVGLTDEQKAEIDRLLPLWKAKEEKAREYADKGDRDAARNAYMQLQNEVRTKLGEILTPEQRKKLVELRTSLRRRRPRGGDQGGGGR